MFRRDDGPRARLPFQVGDQVRHIGTGKMSLAQILVWWPLDDREIRPAPGDAFDEVLGPRFLPDDELNTVEPGRPVVLPRTFARHSDHRDSVVPASPGVTLALDHQSPSLTANLGELVQRIQHGT